MDFRLTNATDKEAIKDYLDRLPDGKQYDISIVLHKTKRTLDQNGLYFRWVNIIAKETGNDTDTTHKALAKKFLGVEVVDVMGEKVARIKSTTKLNTAEFTDYLTQVESFAVQELGIILPHPEDRYFEQVTL